MHSISLPGSATRSFILALIILLIVFTVFPLAPQPVSAQDGPTGAAFRGERIFRQNCAACHGEGGRGDGSMADQMPVPLPDFGDADYPATRSPEEALQIIANGRMENLMPPWAQSLDETEMWDAVAHIWRLSLSEADLNQAQEIREQLPGLVGTAMDLSDPAWLSQSDTALETSLADLDLEDLNQLLVGSPQATLAAARSLHLGLLDIEPNVIGNGRMVVTVVNGTSGDEMAQQPLRLFVLEGESLYAERSAETDANGQAVFEALPTESSWVYVIETEYGTVPYGSGMRQFEGSDTLDIAINVYEPGGSLADLLVTRAHWVVSIDTSNRIDVGELYAIANVGDRAYSGDTGSDGVNRVLAFQTPDDAFNVSVEGGDMGGRFLIDGNTVIDTLPLAPGQRQILFRYSLPVDDGVVTISHPVDYPVDTLNLLVPDLGMTIDAPGWVEGQRMQTQTGDYLNYSITGLSPGDNAEATFTGLQASSFSSDNAPSTQGQQIIDANATPGISGQPWLPYVVVALSVLVLGLGIYFVQRRHRMLLAQAPARRDQVKEDLLAEIVELDLAYEAGDVGQSEYERERRVLKSQLAGLLQEDGA